MVLSRVQKKTAAGTSTAPAVTLDAAPTNGNLLFLIISSNGGTITIPAGWTAHPLSPINNGVGLRTACCYKVAGAGESATITASQTGSNTWRVVAAEYAADSAGTWALDKNSSNSGSSAAADSGTTAATTQAIEVWLAALPTAGNRTQSAPTNGFGLVDGGGTTQACYLYEKLAVATGTANAGATMSGSSNWIGYVATFKFTASGQTVAVGTASETDTAIALGRAKARAAGTASETDSAIALGRLKAKPIGLATETDTAIALAHRRARAIGLATETDAAFAIGRYRTRAVGLALETDQAIALGRLKAKPIMVAVETDTAIAFGISRGHSISTALETDSAFAIGRYRTRAVGLALETDQAIAIAHRLARALGVALETDAAFAIGRYRTRAAGTATETDTAIAFGRRHTRAVGLATEIDQAITFVRLHARALGTASETDTAFAIGRRHTRAVGVALETDSALHFLHPTQLHIGTALEVDSAGQLAVVIVIAPHIIRPTGWRLQLTTLDGTPRGGVTFEKLTIATEISGGRTATYDVDAHGGAADEVTIGNRVTRIYDAELDVIRFHGRNRDPHKRTPGYIHVVAGSPWMLLDRRKLRTLYKTTIDRDQGLIFADLVSIEDTRAPIRTRVALPIPASVTRGVNYELGTSLRDALDALTTNKLDDGLYFLEIPIDDTDGVYTQLELRYPLAGGDAPGCRFEYAHDAGEAIGNISNYEITENLPTNAALGLGSGQGGVGSGDAASNAQLTSYQQDAGSIDEFDLLETTVQFSDVKVQATLDAHTADALEPAPGTTIVVTPLAGGGEVAGRIRVPRLWRDFDVGVVGRVTIHDGANLLQNVPVRINQAKITISDDDASEQLDSLTLEVV